MNQYYVPWYQKNGIRMAGQLLSPPLRKLELMDLPKQSLLHYVTTSQVENGPASDDFIFRSITKPIMVGHVVLAGDTKGNPRHLAVSPDTLIRTYHIKHRRFRIMRNLEASAKDHSSLLVYNYGMLPNLYKYMRSFYTTYYKWWNIQAAVWKKMAEVANKIDVNQFIVCNLPTVLPSISDLRDGSKIVNQKTVKIFNSPESLMILELWKWFGAERKDSVLNFVPADKLDKINIIYQESGRFFVMNLGRMNKWRNTTKEEISEGIKPNTKGIDAKQLQMRFLCLMMALFQVRTVPVIDKEEDEVVEGSEEITADETIVKDNNDTVSNNKDLQPVVVKKDAKVPDIDKTTGKATTKTEIKPIHEEAKHDDKLAEFVDESIKEDEELHKRIEAELAELEAISKMHHGDIDEEGEVKSHPVIQEAPSLEGGVMRVCDRLADTGLLSAAEYRRFDDLSKTYRNIVSPNGVDTLDKFITIEPKVLAIESSREIKDIPTVTDKSMLKSSLHDFDSKYITHVLQKDIAGMVMNVQHAGIAVTDYSMEPVSEVMGDYNIYTVKVKPVEGAPSVLRYKLPVLSQDGSFTSNGVKYRMRKQRGD